VGDLTYIINVNAALLLVTKNLYSNSLLLRQTISKMISIQ